MSHRTLFSNTDFLSKSQCFIFRVRQQLDVAVDVTRPAVVFGSLGKCEYGKCFLGSWATVRQPPATRSVCCLLRRPQTSSGGWFLCRAGTKGILIRRAYGSRKILRNVFSTPNSLVNLQFSCSPAAGSANRNWHPQL